MRKVGGMEKVNYTDNKAKQFVHRFCEKVLYLREVRHIIKLLFENEETHNLINKTAPSFFYILRNITMDYLLLEFAKITDPAISKANKEDENFTVENLVTRIYWPKDIEDKLILLNENTKTFRKYIQPARHKMLAHTDKKIFLSGQTLGAFPKEDDEKFLDVLEKICNIAHEACFNTIYGKMYPNPSGDVNNLIRALGNSLAFESLLSESSGKEKIRLYDYVKDAKNTIYNDSIKEGHKT
jgi:hypothetical protein